MCCDAENDGNNRVEAYPIVRENDEVLDFAEPIRLYKKVGSLCADKKDKIQIMQNNLQ